MPLSCFYKKAAKSIPVHVITEDKYDAWLETNSSDFEKNYLNSICFKPSPNVGVLIAGINGHCEKVLYSIDPNLQKYSLAGLAKLLPQGNYKLFDKFKLLDMKQALLSYGLACYSFDRYKQDKKEFAKLFLSDELLEIEKYLEAHYLVRDLINTPAADMGPLQLSNEAQQIAHKYSANFHEIVGDDLIKHNYPAIYAVGKACSNKPRLIDFTWGDSSNPKLTLVGKGVCFDTGGLDLKPAAGMLIMHKDMGGSAHVLGLAKLIMEFNLPVRLRVLIPAVENVIDGNAYHPSDIITMRNGTSVEINNTDAEGRLVLADSLTEAQSDKPDLIIDIATLTGAIKVGLGDELPGLFSNNNELARKIMDLSFEVDDHLWHMPLYSSYTKHLKSNAADLSNCSSSKFGGGITAALFLESFVGNTDWVHIDLMAWNSTDELGRPKGGEAMGIKTLFAYLNRRYN